MIINNLDYLIIALTSYTMHYEHKRPDNENYILFISSTARTRVVPVLSQDDGGGRR